MVRSQFHMDSRYKIYIIGYSNEEAICGPVYLHIDFENYKGIYIGDSNNNKLVFKRMIPNKYIKFFFTVDGKPYYADNI